MRCRSWKQPQRLSGILSTPAQFKGGDDEIRRGEVACLKSQPVTAPGVQAASLPSSTQAGAHPRVSSISLTFFLTGVKRPVPWSLLSQ